MSLSRNYVVAGHARFLVTNGSVQRAPVHLPFNGTLSADEMRLIQQGGAQGKFTPIYSTLTPPRYRAAYEE
jgi:hypothetical protein